MSLDNTITIQNIFIFELYVVPVEYITYLVVNASDFIVGIGSLRDERVR